MANSGAVVGQNGNQPKHRMKILVTGATGYIGGRLVPRLVKRGHDVRCLVRDADRIAGRDWLSSTRVFEGDALDETVVAAALRGVDVAYYLIHSLAAGEDRFEELDREVAHIFGRVAHYCGVKRIIYLGGLEPKGSSTSAHLASRLDTGLQLSASGVPVTEFRAGVIVGSGSLSFELVRYLTERVPVMICPRWVKTTTHPIAVKTVLDYLVEALDTPESTGRIIEIGGKETLTYADMFRGYARVRNLKRIIIKIPFLTPRLSALWVGLITPINTKLARPLIEGLSSEVVVTDSTASDLFDVETTSYTEAVERALHRFQADSVETSWHGAISSSRPGGLVSKLETTAGMISEVVQTQTRARPEDAFGVIRSLGGDNGWLYARFLWQIRGLMDLLVGGVGLRRGRRSSTDLRVGDAVDFWRVEAFEPNRLLRLRAEMKVPGRAWLQYEIVGNGGGTGCFVTQTAFFEPRGLPGLLYWYILYPIHKVIFRGMIRELRSRAESARDSERNTESTKAPAARALAVEVEG
jgi:uncharacterized protein YbjT (DUF2867 family)